MQPTIRSYLSKDDRRLSPRVIVVINETEYIAVSFTKRLDWNSKTLMINQSIQVDWHILWLTDMYKCLETWRTESLAYLLSEAWFEFLTN